MDTKKRKADESTGANSALEKKCCMVTRAAQLRKHNTNLQPWWVYDQGVVLALWKFMTSLNYKPGSYAYHKDWLRFTATCKGLRAYSVLCNQGLHIQIPTANHVHRFLPPGTAQVSIDFKTLGFDFKTLGFCALPKIPDTVGRMTLRRTKGVPCMPPELNPLARPESILRLPHRLVQLVLGSGFTWPVQEWKLPETLEELEILKKFNQPVVGWVLPCNLRILKILSYTFDQPLVGWQLPDSLVHLQIDGKHSHGVVGWVLPQNLKRLVLGGSFNQPVEQWALPSGLLLLHLSWVFNKPVSKWKLPATLKDILLGNAFNQPVQGWALPESVIELYLGSAFNKPISGWPFSRAITYLDFGNEFNMPTDGWQLPPALAHLSFGNEFNQPMTNLNLPETLACLRFGSSFNQPMEGVKLPSSLGFVGFGMYFDQPLKGWKLPPAVVCLKLGCRNGHHVNGWELPHTLKYLQLGFKLLVQDADVEWLLNNTCVSEYVAAIPPCSKSKVQNLNDCCMPTEVNVYQRCQTASGVQTFAVKNTYFMMKMCSYSVWDDEFCLCKNWANAALQKGSA